MSAPPISTAYSLALWRDGVGSAGAGYRSAGRPRRGDYCKLIKEFAGLRKVGEQVHLQWVIYFPWVPHEGKFEGELIYSIRQL